MSRSLAQWISFGRICHNCSRNSFLKIPLEEHVLFQGQIAKRRTVPIRNVDLRMAWQEYAKDQLQQDTSWDGLD